MSSNAVLGGGSLESIVLDNELYLSANDLAALFTGAALALTGHYLAYPSDKTKGQIEALVELAEQTDALRNRELSLPPL